MKQNATELNLLSKHKFIDVNTTADGSPRARVALKTLETLWINTGTLCNLTCRNCYIESSPKNDRLAYISAPEVAVYLNEIEQDGWNTDLIGFTGGEPFMNPELPDMAAEALERGFKVLILTNGMKPMMKQRHALLSLHQRYGPSIALRVSIDHYTPSVHELERGKRSWNPAIEGMRWLADNGIAFSIAGRMFSGESEEAVRYGFGQLFRRLNIALDAFNPAHLILFPEMDGDISVPEITEACWRVLGKSPEDVMCASSRMVLKRKGAYHPVVVSCTLLPYDKQFELGRTLAEANVSVALNHPHCARFCVLGGASCSQ